MNRQPIVNKSTFWADVINLLCMRKLHRMSEMGLASIQAQLDQDFKTYQEAMRFIGIRPLPWARWLDDDLLCDQELAERYRQLTGAR